MYGQPLCPKFLILFLASIIGHDHKIYSTVNVRPSRYNGNGMRHVTQHSVLNPEDRFFLIAVMASDPIRLAIELVRSFLIKATPLFADEFETRSFHASV